MSLHRLTAITIGVPDVEGVAVFYRDFGLDELAPGRFATAHGGEQLRLVASPRRRLVEVGIGVDDEDDLGRIEARLRRLGVESARTARGLETRDPAAGVGIVVAVAPRIVQAPEACAPYNGPGRRDRAGRAPGLEGAPVRPRKLGHVVYGSPDFAASQRLWVEGVGFKVSDEIRGLAAFLRCSTDHHNLAFGKSSHRGFHHASYEVGSFDEVGMGGMWMRERGWQPAWGLGRHAIGSNVFYYIRDPWGSYAEYFHDIDYIPEDAAWEPRDWEEKYALYCWGPDVPRDFIENKEAAG
jgi:hypothetical protein